LLVNSQVSGSNHTELADLRVPESHVESQSPRPWSAPTQDRLFGDRESQRAPASTYQVEDQHDDCHNDQKVNQGSADMEGESQQPQNHKNDDDCPEHFYLLRTTHVRINVTPTLVVADRSV
jgi:hypothetical protein